MSKRGRDTQQHQEYEDTYYEAEEESEFSLAEIMGEELTTTEQQWDDGSGVTELDFGIVGVGEAREVSFNLTNVNPVRLPGQTVRRYSCFVFFVTSTQRWLRNMVVKAGSQRQITFMGVLRFRVC